MSLVSGFEQGWSSPTVVVDLTDVYPLAGDTLSSPRSAQTGGSGSWRKSGPFRRSWAWYSGSPKAKATNAARMAASTSKNSSTRHAPSTDVDSCDELPSERELVLRAKRKASRIQRWTNQCNPGGLLLREFKDLGQSEEQERAADL